MRCTENIFEMPRLKEICQVQKGCEIFYMDSYAIEFLHFDPSLNTQSCIKGLLVVRDFCFWAVWAAWPVHKKSLGPIMSNF